MRIAANEVERQLEQAAEEARRESQVARSSRLDELVAAFRRADELRRVPFGQAVVRGRKSRQPQTVLTTGFRELINGVEYRRCLVRYTPTQDLCRRSERPRFVFHNVPGRGRVLQTAVMPQYYHSQMIRTDRLEEA